MSKKAEKFTIGEVRLYRSKGFTYDNTDYNGGLNLEVELLDEDGMPAGNPWHENRAPIVNRFAQFYAESDPNPKAQKVDGQRMDFGVNPWLPAKLKDANTPCPIKKITGYYTSVDLPAGKGYVYITRGEDGNIKIRRKNNNQRTYKVITSIPVFVYCRANGEPWGGADEKVLAEAMVGSLIMEETAALRAESEGSSAGSSSAEELFGSQGVKEAAPVEAKAEQSATPAAAPTTPPLPE